MTIMTIISFILINPSYLLAQKIGLGTSIVSGITSISDNSNIVPVGLNNILIPIKLERFRIEPEIALLRINDESNENNDKETSTTSIFQIGVNAHYLFDIDESLKGYVGPKLGMTYGSISKEVGDNSSDISTSSLYLGIGTGCEYFFSKNFSLGGEIQLSYINRGNPEVSTNGENDKINETSSIITTNAQVVVRWYVF